MTDSLLQNPYFWLGQFGLLQIVIACLALAEIRQKTAKRPYIYALWLLAGLALWCMGTPMIGGHPLPAPIYLLEFGVGIVFTLGYFQVRSTPGLVVSDEAASFLRRTFLIGGIGGLLLICGVSFIVAYQEQKALARQLLAKEEQRRKEQALQHKETMKAITADTTLKAETAARLDTVTGQLAAARAEVAKAKAERDKLLKRTDAIKRDTETLKKAAVRAGRQLPAINKIQPKDTLQNEVRKGFFKRLFGHTGQSDSLGTIAAH